MLLLRRGGLYPKSLVQASLGTIAQTLCWDRRFVELGPDALAFWPNAASHEAARGAPPPPGAALQLTALSGLGRDGEELALRFRPDNGPDGRRNRAPRCVHLRAASTTDAQAWEEAIRAAAASCFGRAELPRGWDAEAMARSVTGSNRLVNKQAMPEDLNFLMQRMLDHSYICKATKDRRGQEVPLRLAVEQVVRIQNGPAWIDYTKMRERIGKGRRVRPTEEGEQVEPEVLTASLGDPLVHAVLGELDSAANEKWLFHGTTSRAVRDISEDEFSVDLAGSRTGLLYGKGVYLAECSSKADEYAEEDEDGCCVMLLCCASLGQVLVNSDRHPNSDQLAALCKAGQYDSLCGDRWRAVGTFREFVFYDSAQVYPAYVVRYRRIMQADLLLQVRNVSQLGDTKAAGQLVPHVARMAVSHPDMDVRYRIVMVLSTHAEAVVPVLISNLNDWRVRIRRIAVSVLRELAKSSTNSSHRVSEAGPPSALAVPALVQRIQDTRECLVVRCAAAGSLENLGNHANSAVPALVTALRDDNEVVRSAIAAALGQMGSQDAVPALKRCLTDADSQVCSAAAKSLGQLGKQAVTASQGLTACLGHSCEDVRREAATALGKLGDHAAPAVPVLIGLLQDAATEVRCAAVSTLGVLGAHSSSAVARLMECLNDPSPEVRGSAAKALGQLNEHATPAVPLLASRGLKDPSDEVRLQAATALADLHALGHLGAHAGLVTQAMRERLKDNNGKVRKAAGLGLSAPVSGSKTAPAQLFKKVGVANNGGGSARGQSKDAKVKSWRRTESQMKIIRAAYAGQVAPAVGPGGKCA